MIFTQTISYPIRRLLLNTLNHLHGICITGILVAEIARLWTAISPVRPNFGESGYDKPQLRICRDAVNRPSYFSVCSRCNAAAL